MFDSLIELGFNKNDALVYEALALQGPSFVGPLVRVTKKHRQIVYNSLNSLAAKHLISLTKKNGKNFYSISDPHRMVVEIKNKETIAESLVRVIEQNQKHEQEQVEVFAGASSYERGAPDFRRQAVLAKEYIVIRGETKGWFDQARSFFPQHVDELKKMKRLGIDIFIAFFENERELAGTYMGKHLGNPYICKIIPDEYKLPHTVWLAGDHVYILTPAADPLVVHIKSKSLAAQYREYFWNIWGKGEMLKVG